MELKWTITAGELLQCFSLIIAAFTVYNRLSLKINTIDTKVNMIYDWWQETVTGSNRHKRVTDGD